MNHLIILPILIPLLVGALLLVLPSHERLKRTLSLLATLALVPVALLLVQQADGGRLGVYALGDWRPPFGIVLMLDRLNALLLLTAAVLGSAVVLYALRGDDRRGPRFHALLQFQLLGINGSFLTGDLFNLFVFFEILLIASYALLLYGRSAERVRAGLHYVILNLTGSALFLIALGLIYGISGTLNMADLSARAAATTGDRVPLLAAAGLLLLLVFSLKAALLPLYFWLPRAYASASAPVAALFAIMTKVGFYTVLRLWTLLFSGQAGASAFFGGQWLVYGGLATLACAAVSILAAQRLERMASLSILVSAGTLLAAIGFGQTPLTSAALFYMVSSTLALCALFLLAELIERSRSANELPLDEDADALPSPLESLQPPKGINLDDEQKAVVGQVIPWTMAFLGFSFIACALLVIGMPPLSGFVGKFSLITALFNPLGMGVPAEAPLSASGWALLALLVLSGMASLIALVRLGVQRFWKPEERPSPLLRMYECVPIVALLSLCVVLSLWAEPLMRYTQDTAASLKDPGVYIEAVLGTRPIPGPTTLESAQVQP